MWTLDHNHVANGCVHGNIINMATSFQNTPMTNISVLDVPIVRTNIWE